MGNVTVLKSVRMVASPCGKLQESVVTNSMILHGASLIVRGGVHSHETCNHYLYSLFIVNIFYLHTTFCLD
jgi:hypothetical protein